MNHDEFPDKTLSKLEEEGHVELDNLKDDLTDEVEDLKTDITYVSTAIVLSEMFEDDVITLREYIRLTNYIEQRSADLDYNLP